MLSEVSALPDENKTVMRSAEVRTNPPKVSDHNLNFILLTKLIRMHFFFCISVFLFCISVFTPSSPLPVTDLVSYPPFLPLPPIPTTGRK